MKKAFMIFALLACINDLGYTPIVERRGCCSWHGGVCGCSMGRVMCCDGTASPSCRC